MAVGILRAVRTVWEGPMIRQIKKRDGRIESFDQEKIKNAIWKAAKAVGGTNEAIA